MEVPSTFDALSPAIRAALEGRGFTALTAIQEAVLDPTLAGRDLRIFSQTGSGKTVAVGMAVAPDLEKAVAERAAAGAPPSPKARPFALVIAPTRELAAQIGGELSWLFAPLGAPVACVTGGSSYARELFALRKDPVVIAGTPGRMLDHLERGAIDPSALQVVVLDEADQMLDLGFREELEAILSKTPEARRTILLSATFPREVERLANRCQRDPVVAGGCGAGEVNEDIAHVAHLVLPHERDRALINLLLMAPGERALVFVRTREGASDLADKLSNAGLAARAIHGDLEQRERTRTLDAFRAGAITTLVATDVAARGIDVPDIMRVIQADPPGDSEVFTHRSGRTGRAGKKGTSVVLVPPAAREHILRMLRRARLEARWTPAPTAADVLRAADERLAADLARPAAPGVTPNPRLRALAEQLLGAMDPCDLVAALLARSAHAGPCPPAEVTPISPPAPRPEGARDMPRPKGAPVSPFGLRSRGPRQDRPQGTFVPPFGPQARPQHQQQGEGPQGGFVPPFGPQARPQHQQDDGPPLSFVPFRINWGERQGADPRRLLAMVCRRGGIRGNEVGAIRIGDSQSTFEVASLAAADFADAVKKPDARDPRIRIDPAAAVPYAAKPSFGPRGVVLDGAARGPKPLVRADRPPPGGFAPPKRIPRWA